MGAHGVSLHVYLSGPPGVGKSTIAPLLAARLGCASVDLDELIEREAGASVAELFRARGEPAFRELERRAVLELVARDEPLVVALGGGTVEDAGSRARLLSRGVVVTLEAPIDVLFERTSRTPRARRPLLDGDDPRAHLERLLARRRGAYAEAHRVLDGSSMSPEASARVIAEHLALDRRAVLVALLERSYRVVIGSGSSEMLGAELERLSARRLVVVTDANLRSLAERWVAPSGLPATWVVLAPGEASKSLACVERIWDAALDARVDRGAVVVAVGGGVVGDVAGFAAATLLRGLRFVLLPTSLLAMLDSSVGGKTGIDRAQGKNLVGAFHQPSVVLADVDALASLPERELRAGLAELVKTAWIEGEADVRALEDDASALLARTPAGSQACERAIRRAVRTKARVVAADEREEGARRLLNLGHTLGHVVEAASGYALVHGEAVAIGLVAALRLSEALGVATRADVERLVRLLARFDLPRSWPRLRSGEAARWLALDKKGDGEELRFVVAGAPGTAHVRRLPFREVLSFVEELAAGSPDFL